jgi:hypothetical protein
MKKYLIINEMFNDYFFQFLDMDWVKCVPAYKKEKYKSSFVLRVLRKFGINPLCTTNLDHAQDNYSGVVVFDCSCGPATLQQIKKIGGIPKILFIWNPMDYYLNRLKGYSVEYKLEELVGLFDRVYYFDKIGCKKFGGGVSYFPKVYSSMVSKKFSCSNNYSILFLGAEKNRGEVVRNYNTIFREKKQKTDIYFLCDNEYEKDTIHYFSKRKDYTWYLDKVSQCGAILDIVQEGQTGFTQRVMESIFFEKKLITTNYTIKEYDIYNKNNIFILGEDNIDDIDSFMHTPYCELDEKIINQYDLQFWLKKAFDGIGLY